MRKYEKQWKGYIAWFYRQTLGGLPMDYSDFVKRFKKELANGEIV